MAIDTTTLQADIKTAFQNANAVTDPNTRDTALDTLCTAIANAVEKWIKTGTVQVTAPTGGIAVVGSATAQANAAPIPITGSPTDPMQKGGIS